ncbi:kelch domain-containing protein 10 [Rhipicephalus sanguineus]|uniref:kelch domain-containing protein 10 n=1 Tax=Rhipicephalus sanguineus TaxID=34632 RepID=UPI0018932324|nr:kelch domain-containing protein 10 [Rhipicephalus sanguineus]
MAESFCFRSLVIDVVEPKGPVVPKPRSGHRIVASGASVYAFGGYNPDNAGEDPSSALFKELWRFNSYTKRWTNLFMTGNVPTELASHAALLHHDKMLVYGGTGVPFGERISNRLYAFNLRSHHWDHVPTSGDLPYEQYGQAMCCHNGYLYVLGGTTGFEYSMEVHRLSLDDLTWKRLPCEYEPTRRYRHELAVYEDRIIVLGGGTAHDSLPLRKLPAFHTNTLRWEALFTAPDPRHGFPAKRRCHSSVQYHNSVFVCGGHTGTRVLDDVWRLDLPTLQWRRLPISLPSPVYFHAAAVTESGQMFVFGGVTAVDGTSRCNSLWSMWLTVPSLLELSWLALLQAAPWLATLPPRQLARDGVPLSILERLQH